MKKYEQALPLLEKLIQKNENDFNCNVNLAQIYSEKEFYDLKKAHQYLDKALSIAKKDEELSYVYFIFGKISFKQSLFLEAEKHFKKSLNYNSKHIYSALLLAKCYIKLENESELKKFLVSYLKKETEYFNIFSDDEELKGYLP
ncbi:MAG: tetratricopeptide repeat protein, partial [Candidatus Thorarchaeota archaeon]